MYIEKARDYPDAYHDYRVIYTNGQPVLDRETGEPVRGSYAHCVAVFTNYQLTGVLITR